MANLWAGQQDPLQQQQGARPPQTGGVDYMAGGAGGAAPPVGAGAGGAAPVGAGAGGASPVQLETSQPQTPVRTAQDFRNWATSRYGQAPTEAQLGQLAQRVGYTGGDINEDMWNRATQAADVMARQAGWQGAATATPTTPHTPGPGVAPPQTTAPQTQTSAPDPNQAALQQRIQQMLQTNTGDVNTTSQEYQSQRGAFDRGQQRQLERAKRAAAERSAGMGGAGMDAAMNQLDMEAAGQAGNFEAQLATQQIERQRDDLQNALQLAQQSGLAGEARQLQERLANLDAQLQTQGQNLGANMQQQGLNLQGELGRGDLDLRRYLGRGQLGLGLLGTLLGDQRSRDALGFNYAQLGNQINQQTLQQLLGAL